MQIVDRCLMVAGFCALIGCGEDTGTSSAASTGGSSTTEAMTGETGETGETSGTSGTTVTPTEGGETEGQTTGPTTTPTTGPDTGTSDTGTSDTGSETGSSTGGPGPVCGDGVAEVGVEACDGADLGGLGCADLGFDGGELGCLDTCMHDIAACTACGDGEVDPGEGCDDGNVMAGDGCDAACQSEEACDPDGPWKIEGAPIAYTCCVGLVNLNITGFLFAGDGATISSSPSNPIAMTGEATSCPVGGFSNQGQLAGGCTETYKLEGDFVDANTWKGTYTLDFEGEQCSCFQGMLGAPCIDQVVPVTATR